MRNPPGSGQVVLDLQFLLDDLAVTTPPAVEVRPVLVPDLTSRLPSPVLTSLDEPGVEIRPDDPVVQSGAVDVPHSVLAVLSEIVLHKTEPTGSPLELVQPHDDSLDLPAHPEELVYLLLGGVEAHVADVEGGGLPEQPLLLPTRSLQ